MKSDNENRAKALKADSSQRQLRKMAASHKGFWHMGGCVCAMKPRRRFITWTLVVTLALLLVTVGGEDFKKQDWTAFCATGCKCTWVSGKKVADCRGRDWSSIPSGLSPEVQVLEMGGSTIKFLPKDAFKSVDLVNLQKLFLQNSRIERIDRDAFRDLEIMIELDLSGNLISSLEMETFESNVRLRELRLVGNPLTTLTGRSFPSLRYLQLLDLSDCQLSSFPSTAFENLKWLETLAIGGNRFSYLSEDILKPLEKLKSLSVTGNPWKCDCRLKSFRDWVIKKNLFQHHTKCFEPSAVANMPWDKVPMEDFACRPEIVSVQINGKPTGALLVHTAIGSDITLQCLVRGHPLPDLKWVRDGQVLTNTSRAYGKSYYLHIGDQWDLMDEEDSVRGRWVNLTIQKLDQEDAGEYTCVGNNGGGVVEKNLTLNFQDVPSGAGVGHGLGGLASGSYRDSGWIWVLVSVVVLILFVIILVSLLLCFCSRRRRVKTTRAQELKGDDQPQQRQLLLTPNSAAEKEKEETMLLMKDSYLVGPDARSQQHPNNHGDKLLLDRPSSSSSSQAKGGGGTPIPPAASLTGGPHGSHPSSEYPDLLDLPHSRSLESPAPSTVSTLPDSTRMLITPQQLNPALLVHNPNPRLTYQQPIYGGRPVSPYGVTPFSPSEPAIVPTGSRPGYVTLPRRHRVPSWSPANTASPLPCPPSPTGSAATVSLPFVKTPGPKYDNLGKRTSADGSSRLSLNNIGLPEPDSRSSTPAPRTNNFGIGSYGPSPLVTGTLGRHSVLRSTPVGSMLGHPVTQFAPIEEIEPVNSTVSPENDEKASEQISNSNPDAVKTEPAFISNGTAGSKRKVPPKPPPKPAKKANLPNGQVDMKEENNDSSSPTPLLEEGDDGTEV